jgi:hypothetical protein
VATNGLLTYTLESGNVFQASCIPPDVPTADSDYCIATLGDDNSFAFGLSTEVHQGDYTLCVQPPSGDPLCRVFPIGEPEPGRDYRLALGACLPDRGSGTYTVSWTVEGQLLGTLSQQPKTPRARALPGQPGGAQPNEQRERTSDVQLTARLSVGDRTRSLKRRSRGYSSTNVLCSEPSSAIRSSTGGSPLARARAYSP